MKGRNSEEGGGFIRLKITSVLAGLGALGGAVAGFTLTIIGHVVSGYPITPGFGVFAWNIGIMSGVGAVLGPPLVWTVLRRVPLWRAVAEPALAGIVSSVGVMLLVPPLFPIVVPGAIIASAVRLARAYPEGDAGKRGRTLEGKSRTGRESADGFG